jgi:hypothetical protein
VSIRLSINLISPISVIDKVSYPHKTKLHPISTKEDTSIEEVLLAINTLLQSLNSYHLKNSFHFDTDACGKAARDGLTLLLQLATYSITVVT